MLFYSVLRTRNDIKENVVISRDEPQDVKARDRDVVTETTSLVIRLSQKSDHLLLRHPSIEA